MQACYFDKCPYSFDELLLSDLSFDDVACKCVGADEVAQLLAVCVENSVAVPLPKHFAFDQSVKNSIGNMTFSMTVAKSKSALPWKSTPMFCLSAFFSS